MSKVEDGIAYEPFGEHLDLPDAGLDPVTRRRERGVGTALFWTVAVVLVAGRIYFLDQVGV